MPVGDLVPIAAHQLGEGEVQDHEQLCFRPNVTQEQDTVETPTEPMTKRWPCPDFFEFDRVFKCARVEFIYLIKGFAYEKMFSL